MFPVIFTDLIGLQICTVTTAPHSHEHTNGHTKREERDGVLDASEKVSRLDRLIAFFDAYFEGVELLEPEEAFPSMQEQHAQRAAEDEDINIRPEQPTQPVLRIKLDDKVAFVPVESMVSASQFIICTACTEPLSRHHKAQMKLCGSESQVS